MHDPSALLRAAPYPGRGILIGENRSNSIFILYFLMGRSENSRNRLLKEEPDGSVRTVAANPLLLKDPSLVIYTALRRIDGGVVVTNGDQTDTICKTLAAGGSFEEALRGRTFEPDAPIHTPRISAMARPGYGYRMSILKAGAGSPPLVRRFFYEYPQPAPGEGHLIHTYANGADLPSFCGEPVPVAVEGDIDDFANTVWDALNAENKVAMLALSIDRLSEGKLLLFGRG